MGTDRKSPPNDKLRRAREELCWMQQDVADKLYDLCMKEDANWTTGITADQVGRWERGVKPSVKYQRKLCVLFGKDPQELGFITEPLVTKPDMSEVPQAAASPLSHPPKLVIIPSLPSQIVTLDSSAYPDGEALSHQAKFFPIDAAALHTTHSDYGVVTSQPLASEYNEKKSLEPEPESSEEVKRRQFVGGLAAITSGALFMPPQPLPLSLMKMGKLLHNEETISICTSHIPILWRLYFDGHFIEVQQNLPSHLSQLSTLVQESNYQKKAAVLASKATQLAALIEKHHYNFGNALIYAKQGEQYGWLAEDPNLQIASLIQQANLCFDLKRPRQELEAYEKAYQVYLEAKRYSDISPLLLGRVYIGLAKSYGKFKEDHKQTALRFLNKAHEIYPEHPEEDPAFHYTCHSRFTLLNHTGLTYLNIEEPEQALSTFKAIDAPAGLVPRRVELAIRSATVFFALGDLKQCDSYVRLAATSARTIGSDLRYNEAYDIFQQMLVKWPHEKQVKDLVEHFQL